ncbi:MAG TPA: hypothetical protein VJQ57_10485 [Acidimicrobiia bacterium]|nr:hypothetical protein [Acidimicrobiia bacterium]
MKKSGWIGPFLFIVVLACSNPTPPTTTASAATTIAAPSTTAAASTTVAALEPPPWNSAPPLAAAEVPVLATEWGEAENRENCAALAPSGGIGGATPRPANFSGGWAVAWDAPEGPGMAADGTFCEDCGRSAVGVAGAGVAAVEAEVRAFPNVIEWNDGSLLGYGVEGSVAGAVDDAATTGGDSATQLAFLSVTGQNCLYNVWSRRSETELLDVIGRLRFVEGLGAPSG